MKRTIPWLGTIFILIFCITPARAAETSQTIAFRGCDDGLTGTVDLRLRLFDAATGGNQVFEETQTGVAVDAANCVSVRIGNVTALMPGLFTTYPSLWVAFALDATPDMELGGGRTPLTANGYAFRAVNADQAAMAQTAATAQTLNPGATVSGDSATPILTVNNANPNGQALVGKATTTTGATAVGVYGETSALLGRGVHGKAAGSGIGVFGEGSTAGTGVFGTGRVGVQGTGSFTGGLFSSASGDILQGVAGFGSMVFRVTNQGDVLASGTMRSGGQINFTDASGTPYPDNWIGMANNIEGATKWLHIGGITDAGARRIALAADKTLIGGNVGIGTASPDAKLHVNGSGFFSRFLVARTTEAESNGVSGIATTGDAPYGVYGSNSSNPSPRAFAGYFFGKVRATGGFFSGFGASEIDHPLDPDNKYLVHPFVASSEMKNLYDGIAVLDARGEAWVDLPEYFEALNRDYRYQLTGIGGFAPVYIAQKIAGNRFQIAGGPPGMEVSWQVTGIRHDALANAHRVEVEREKAVKERNYYLHPALYGQSDEKAIEWAHKPEWMRRMKAAREK